MLVRMSFNPTDPSQEGKVIEVSDVRARNLIREGRAVKADDTDPAEATESASPAAAGGASEQTPGPQTTPAGGGSMSTPNPVPGEADAASKPEDTEAADGAKPTGGNGGKAARGGKPGS